MSRSSSEAPDGDTPARSGAGAGDLEAIRQLLIAPEKKQLDALQERIEDPAQHARAVSQVLPQAVALSSARDSQLATALAPAVESALEVSVKKDPSILVNAVFPVIGPAIRKSISEVFSKLVQSLNQTLEYGLSLRGLGWRLEALRTGRSFAEVVLAHTLLYRVEQVFLIHRQTGLLLQHIQAPHIQSQDPGMISSMLTAIQDFAQDSFRAPAGEALNTLEIGELKVWIESGPLATVAAVIRGRAPYEYRTVLEGVLETIHREQGPALHSFVGDAAPFELARPSMESCLLAQFSEPTWRRSTRLVALAAVVGILLVAWLWSAIRQHRRWAGYIERLKSEPGIVVTEAGRKSGKYFVAGLRDPLARDPNEFLTPFELSPDQVGSRWEAYQALDAEFVQRRAIALLKPPPRVRLEVKDGVLFAEGIAPAGWISQLRTEAFLLPGIRELRDSKLVQEATGFEGIRRSIEQVCLQFDDGLRLTGDQQGVIETLAAQMNQLREAALSLKQSARIKVVGHTDRTGSDELNLRLSRERADEVVGLLAQHGVSPSLLFPIGVADKEPLESTLAGQDELRNRRVTFRVYVEESASSGLP
jgi:OOP family OmpA-OmpF porin